MPPIDPREKAYRDFLDNELAIFNGKVENCTCPRDELENFKLLRIYGQGGFGRVFGTFHEPSQSQLALKILRKSNLVRKNKVELIIREKKFQWAMNSDFCVRLLAAFKDTTNVYLSMELGILGALDKQVYSDEGLPDATWRLIAGMIVLGIEYLHACNILYRDLKPENVFVFSDGYVKLGDFGLAVRGNPFIADFMGTLPYMAPEMFSKNQACLDNIDWWAFGVTLYEMYSQNWVFGADPDAQNASRLIAEAIPIFIHPPVPDIACDLIEKVLVKDVTKRLGSLDNGSQDIKDHKFFEGINFLDLYEKKIVIDVSSYSRFEHKVFDNPNYPLIRPVDIYEEEFRDF